MHPLFYLFFVEDDRNILLQIPKPLPIKEKSSVLNWQNFNFAYTAFASPLTWGKLV
ncbi:MAG: hypothetical protein ACO3NK_17790 [Prochlorotrichaceae cyanobacterium]